MSRLSILKEIIGFLDERKKWWSNPRILFLFWTLIFLTEGTATSPFIYDIL